jgi:hypothetical protein
LSLTLSLAAVIVVSSYYFILNKPRVNSFPGAYVYDTPTPVPPPPPPAPSYQMSYGYIYYSQKSDPWGSISIGGGKCKFSNIGCGTTVTASVVSTKKNSTIYNPSYIYYTNFPNLSCSGFGVQDVDTILRQRYNISTTRVIGRNSNTLKNAVTNNVKSGKKMIVGAKIYTPSGSVNHVTMIVGYNSRSKALIFNDPLFGAGIMLETMGGYSVDWSTAVVYIVN